MKRKTSLNHVLLASVGFTILLLVVRMVWSGQRSYMFYPWNLFLAYIPLLVSSNLFRVETFRFKAITLLLFWLLFFPNAPYLITDIFHLVHRPPVPLWFDLVLVTSAAVNGLMLGIISLVQVEHFLLLYVKMNFVKVLIPIAVLLSAFGIYLGRFLRFNSWDVVTDPSSLAYSVGYRLINPMDHPRAWGFTILFASMFWLFYMLVKALGTTMIENELKLTR